MKPMRYASPFFTLSHQKSNFQAEKSTFGTPEINFFGQLIHETFLLNQSKILSNSYKHALGTNLNICLPTFESSLEI